MNSFVINILEQGFIFGIMVLGVYITYKILDFPDLSVEGSFPLGASICAKLLVMGVNPIMATLAAVVGGLLGGAITAFLHVKLKITNLLSGILVMIGLYSINLRIMGKANIPLFSQSNIFDIKVPKLIIIMIIAVSVKYMLDMFLNTKFGFLIRATGDNPKLVTSLGIDIGVTKFIALMVSNGLVALSGALVCQYQRFSDAGMGTGIIVMGLASIIFGESIFKNLKLINLTTMALLGSILYKTSVALALKLGFPPTDLKLITALIVAIMLGVNNKKMTFKFKGFTVGGRQDAVGTKSV
ncbi:ABC transporter permease [Anaeromicrobium sediminis]|uniref:ABC transporter permease n=1 Tax=Anaeromicrobium sediminis TaxID=1478221 RepID=A0A267MEA2_9FIRM|nr:ABC transporter permease [Anaeromicrobium sediminis]PAB57123.1 ABC transporter permease [Anaeromicrobium sediminis]